MAFLKYSIFLYLIIGISGIVGQENFIYGGNDAAPGQFPYQVSLRNKNNQHYCSGAIINNRWILTTAFCATTNLGSVVAGSVLLDSGGVTYSVEKVVSHESYDSNSLKNNIALVKTVGKIAFNEFTQPIKIASFEIGANVQMTFSGWGNIGPGTLTNKLKFMITNTVTNEECAKIVVDNRVVSPTNVCSYNSTGAAPCRYDDGGPLVRDRILHGLLSWARGCANGFPEVYTRVQSYKSWIWWAKFKN